LNRYQPKDFIETAEGLIFAVVTADLEDQRVLSFLRYQRTSGGYRKLSSRDADELLKKHYPHYVHHSKARDVTLHGVHHTLVTIHHQPRMRLREILLRAPCDEIEAKLQRLAGLFDEQGLDLAELGITGSLLIGAQNKGSDIDLVFYRREAFHKARGIIKSLVLKRLLQPLDDAKYSFDYPARYILDHHCIKEAVSYTATYLGQAERGEYVEVRGQLEISSLGHLRIVIGSNREAIDEYIKVIPL
jgi:predicted nucleotidyltransferase